MNLCNDSLSQSKTDASGSANYGSASDAKDLPRSASSEPNACHFGTSVEAIESRRSHRIFIRRIFHRRSGTRSWQNKGRLKIRRAHTAYRTDQTSRPLFQPLGKEKGLEATTLNDAEYTNGASYKLSTKLSGKKLGKEEVLPEHKFAGETSEQRDDIKNSPVKKTMSRKERGRQRKAEKELKKQHKREVKEQRAQARRAKSALSQKSDKFNINESDEQAESSKKCAIIRNNESRAAAEELSQITRELEKVHIRCIDTSSVETQEEQRLQSYSPINSPIKSALSRSAEAAELNVGARLPALEMNSKGSSEKSGASSTNLFSFRAAPMRHAAFEFDRSHSSGNKVSSTDTFSHSVDHSKKTMRQSCDRRKRRRIRLRAHKLYIPADINEANRYSLGFGKLLPRLDRRVLELPPDTAGGDQLIRPLAAGPLVQAQGKDSSSGIGNLFRRARKGGIYSGIRQPVTQPKLQEINYDEGKSAIAARPPKSRQSGTSEIMSISTCGTAISIVNKERLLCTNGSEHSLDEKVPKSRARSVSEHGSEVSTSCCSAENTDRRSISQNCVPRQSMHKQASAVPRQQKVNPQDPKRVLHESTSDTNSLDRSQHEHRKKLEAVEKLCDANVFGTSVMRVCEDPANDVLGFHRSLGP